MTIKIKLSTGKEIELTKEEYDELYGSALVTLPVQPIPIPVYPNYPTWPSYPTPQPWIVGYPTITYCDSHT